MKVEYTVCRLCQNLEPKFMAQTLEDGLEIELCEKCAYKLED